MSWFSNLVETYDRISQIAGERDEKGNVLLPLNHTLKKSNICITLDGKGMFRRANHDKKAVNVVIPCTSKSETGRTSGIAPHPLHEELKYLAGSDEYREAYLDLLSSWSDYHPKVKAVYLYATANTVRTDLIGCGIKVKDKDFVRFSVETPNDFEPNLWEDKTVAKAWQDYCKSALSEGKNLCYITGTVAPLAKNHPKGINPNANSAKIISCNDESNYTYKGRFTKSEQANSIGAITSHKAHAMLSNIIATQGHKCGTQAVAAWQISDGGAMPDPFASSDGLLRSSTAHEELTKAQAELDFAGMVSNALKSKGCAGNLKKWGEPVAVMSVDASGKGRLGVTFYQEIRRGEYLDCVINWHETCCWHFRGKGGTYISAPSADRIIAAVYGEPKGESYTKIQKHARERLLHCIFRSAPLDGAWVAAAAARASKPFSYSKKDGGWDMWKWMDALSVTCAIVRKYHIQKEEELSLELETTRTDRDYLFGWLLAIADRLESHARYLQGGKDGTDRRPTNAVRHMTAFAAKPLRTWKYIADRLKPHKKMLGGAEWYQRQIDEVMSLFEGMDEISDKPLGGLYLVGYSLQRKTLLKNSKIQEEETENESN